MKIKSFVGEIFHQFPLLIIGNVVLLIIVGILDVASIITVTPVVDLLIHSDPNNYSGLTNKITAILKSVGMPITLSILMTLFLVFNVVRSIFYILSNYLIFKTRLKVVNELMLGTFEDFFNSRWYFFSSNNQGTLINTFSREIIQVADSFGSMATFFSNIFKSYFTLLCHFILPGKSVRSA